MSRRAGARIGAQHGFEPAGGALPFASMSTLHTSCHPERHAHVIAVCSPKSPRSALVARLTSALPSISAMHVVGWPRSAAAISAVESCQLWLSLSTSASWARRRRTSLEAPCCAARCSAVSPHLVSVSRLALSWMSRSAALTWPLSRSGARKREEQTNRPSAILVQAPRIDVPEAREVQRREVVRLSGVVDQRYYHALHRLEREGALG